MNRSKRIARSNVAAQNHAELVKAAVLQAIVATADAARNAADVAQREYREHAPVAKAKARRAAAEVTTVAVQGGTYVIAFVRGIVGR